jgi:hypothetical protein
VPAGREGGKRCRDGGCDRPDPAPAADGPYRSGHRLQPAADRRGARSHGLALRALGGLSRSYLEAPARLRPGPDGVGLETSFETQPRHAGLGIQIERIELTFDAEASKGSFMRMPTSCATGISLARVNSYRNPSAFSEATSTLAPTGRDALEFAPTPEGSLGSPDEL